MFTQHTQHTQYTTSDTTLLGHQENTLVFLFHRSFDI